MTSRLALSIVALAAVPLPGPVLAQTTGDPFPASLEDRAAVVDVGVETVTVLPDFENVPARMMLLVQEPTTERYFVNDMQGVLYGLEGDDRVPIPYLNVFADEWGLELLTAGFERGFQSFAFHPDFGHAGRPGHGRLYTYQDTSDTGVTADFWPRGGGLSHHTVLLEWTAGDPLSPFYDGGPPRELLRVQQPFANHNGGQIAFDPTAGAPDPESVTTVPGPAGDPVPETADPARPAGPTPERGWLYVGSADGGHGGDPLGLAQDLGSIFGKILRIDPLGDDSANGRYGLPPDNPFVADGDPATLGEIYAWGVRNPQRFAWDPLTGALYVADIGQGAVEELSPVTAGANLGWNLWEGSFRYLGHGAVSLESPRSDPAVTYPIAEYDHRDPLLTGGVAITGVVVARTSPVPALEGLIVFGDNPGGHVLATPAEGAEIPGPLLRVRLHDADGPTTLLDLVGRERASRGRGPASRVDLRLGTDLDGQIYLLNKYDGVIRVLTARPVE